MTPFELDHIFICTDIGGPVADQLIAFGLTEGSPNVHPGQGTANRRFFFHNAMLELLWVHDPEEAQNATTRPIRLWERWNGRQGDALPVAICLRSRHPETEELPFAAWAYTPAYVPSPLAVHIARVQTFWRNRCCSIWPLAAGRIGQTRVSPWHMRWGSKRSRHSAYNAPHPRRRPTRSARWWRWIL